MLNITYKIKVYNNNAIRDEISGVMFITDAVKNILSALSKYNFDYIDSELDLTKLFGGVIVSSSTIVEGKNHCLPNKNELLSIKSSGRFEVKNSDNSNYLSYVSDESYVSRGIKLVFEGYTNECNISSIFLTSERGCLVLNGNYSSAYTTDIGHTEKLGFSFEDICIKPREVSVFSFSPNSGYGVNYIERKLNFLRTNNTLGSKNISRGYNITIGDEYRYTINIYSGSIKNYFVDSYKCAFIELYDESSKLSASLYIYIYDYEKRLFNLKLFNTSNLVNSLAVQLNTDSDDIYNLAKSYDFATRMSFYNDFIFLVFGVTKIPYGPGDDGVSLIMYKLDYNGSILLEKRIELSKEDTDKIYTGSYYSKYNSSDYCQKSPVLPGYSNIKPMRNVEIRKYLNIQCITFYDTSSTTSYIKFYPINVSNLDIELNELFQYNGSPMFKDLNIRSDDTIDEPVCYHGRTPIAYSDETLFVGYYSGYIGAVGNLSRRISKASGEKLKIEIYIENK